MMNSEKSEGSSVKIDRLVSIIMILLERRKMSATRLAELFEVSTRTIFRDIEAINMAGVPVVAYPGVNGGISIMEGYKIDKKLFTPSDYIAMLTGLASISPTVSKREIACTLEKLKTLIPPDQRKSVELRSNQISIDLTAWAESEDTRARMDIIRLAMRESRLIAFSYSDNRGVTGGRKVEPYQLALKDRHWYLRAYCLARRDFRTFRLSRISRLRILDSMFSPREFDPKPLNGSEWIENRLITIRLLVDISLRERVVERCGEKNIRPQGKKKLLADFPFTEDEFGYALLLSFGDQCECLEPEHVRREMLRRINKMLGIYAKG